MNYLKSLFVLLLSLCWTLAVSAQSIYLDIQSTTQKNKAIIDSIGYSKKHKNFNSLQTENKSFQNKLQKIGYIEARHSAVKKINDSTFSSTFTFGKHYKKIIINYKDTLDLSSVEKYITKKTGRSFSIPISYTENFLTRLNNSIASKGNPFNSLQLTHLKVQDSVLTANLQTQEGGFRSIDQIIVKGYDKFPATYIKHYLKLKSGTPFNKKELSKKLKKLENLRFASSYKEPEVLFTKDSTNIYLYLEKKNSNLFDGFLGFATNPETNKLELNGFVNLSLTNNLNYGESLNIEYKNDAQERQHFYAKLKLPYLFNTPFGAQLELKLYKEDSTYTTTTQKIAIDYNIQTNISVFTGYKAKTSTSLTNEVNLSNFTRDYDSKYLTLGAEFINLNPQNRLIPIKTELKLEANIGQRSIENNKTNQVIAEFHGAHIFQLNKRNSIYIGNKSGYIHTDEYLENELFRFGGIKSLRGFEENSLRASFYTAFQTEYRYLLSSNLYAHSIIDFAQTQNGILETNNTLYGVGLGLALQTQVGLLQVNFANGKTKDQNFEFRNSKIHISLTAVF